MSVVNARGNERRGSALRAAAWLTLSVLACATPVPAASAGPQNKSEHPPGAGPRIVLDPKAYWFYEAMGKLENVRIHQGRVEGSYTQRLRRTDFILDKTKLQDPAARTEGYKLAIQKIISYMAPGAVPDNESNRKYMAELKTKLKAITGIDLPGYEEWKKWYDDNRDKLKWSDEKNMLIGGVRPE